MSPDRLEDAVRPPRLVEVPRNTMRGIPLLTPEFPDGGLIIVEIRVCVPLDVEVFPVLVLGLVFEEPPPKSVLISMPPVLVPVSPDKSIEVVELVGTYCAHGFESCETSEV
jgi:hypothetical protein